LIFSDNFLGNSGSFVVVAGALVLRPKLLNSQLRKVTSIFVHPDYVSETLEHDIAVLKMKTPLKLNGKTVTAISLQQDEMKEGVKCSTHGWGFQSYVSCPT
jgi:Trypsin